MILIDANLLIHACLREAERHASARGWLEDTLTAPGRVGLPWPSLLAFVRITTHPRVAAAPLSLATAWGQVAEWLSLDTVWVPMPTEAHAEVLGRLLATPGLTSKDVPDAHLAALALEHGLVLCSADAGFRRFEGVTWRNPLG